MLLNKIRVFQVEDINQLDNISFQQKNMVIPEKVVGSKDQPHIGTYLLGSTTGSFPTFPQQFIDSEHKVIGYTLIGFNVNDISLSVSKVLNSYGEDPSKEIVERMKSNGALALPENIEDVAETICQDIYNRAVSLSSNNVKGYMFIDYAFGQLIFCNIPKDAVDNMVDKLRRSYPDNSFVEPQLHLKDSVSFGIWVAHLLHIDEYNCSGATAIEHIGMFKEYLRQMDHDELEISNDITFVDQYFPTHKVSVKGDSEMLYRICKGIDNYKPQKIKVGLRDSSGEAWADVSFKYEGQNAYDLVVNYSKLKSDDPTLHDGKEYASFEEMKFAEVMYGWSLLRDLIGGINAAVTVLNSGAAVDSGS